jgi:putative transposase
VMSGTRNRWSPEKIVRKLLTADRVVAEGGDDATSCRKLRVAEQTCHRWHN